VPVENYNNTVDLFLSALSVLVISNDNRLQSARIYSEGVVERNRISSLQSH